MNRNNEILRDDNVAAGLAPAFETGGLMPFKNIQLDRESDEHLYIQLFREIKKYILSGELKPNQKLPPIRKLADELGVNTVTIVNAYRLLDEEAFVYKKVGSGTYIAPNSDVASLTQTIGENADERQKDKTVRIDEHAINFASGTPNAELFPVSDFKEVINEVLDRDMGYAFGYQDSQGFMPLRESLVSYLKHYRIQTTTENIQIISGAQQGIDLVSKALLKHNDVVFVEAPTYTGAIATFKSRGAKIVEIPMEQDGMNLELLNEALKKYRPKFIYTMPNFQNPTGYCYSTEKKRALMEIADKYRTLIIEDDYASELNFSENSKDSLKSMDQDGSVIFIKSFSKILMPGLRLGFMIIPLRFSQKILMAKHTTDISTSGLTQRAFDLFIRKGMWENQLNHMQSIYQERYEQMLLSMEQFFPSEVCCHLPDGGINFWFELPDSCNAREVYEEAAQSGVAVVPGDLFYSGEIYKNALRLSTASLYPDAIDIGMEKLSDVLRKCLNLPDKEKIHETFRPIL